MLDKAKRQTECQGALAPLTNHLAQAQLSRASVGWKQRRRNTSKAWSRQCGLTQGQCGLEARTSPQASSSCLCLRILQPRRAHHKQLQNFCKLSCRVMINAVTKLCTNLAFEKQMVLDGLAKVKAFSWTSQANWTIGWNWPPWAMCARLKLVCRHSRCKPQTPAWLQLIDAPTAVRTWYLVVCCGVLLGNLKRTTYIYIYIYI
jgi:hypothetical protein